MFPFRACGSEPLRMYAFALREPVVAPSLSSSLTTTRRHLLSSRQPSLNPLFHSIRYPLRPDPPPENERGSSSRLPPLSFPTTRIPAVISRLSQASYTHVAPRPSRTARARSGVGESLCVCVNLGHCSVRTTTKACTRKARPRARPNPLASASRRPLYPDVESNGCALLPPRRGELSQLAKPPRAPRGPFSSDR